PGRRTAGRSSGQAAEQPSLREGPPPRAARIPRDLRSDRRPGRPSGRFGCPEPRAELGEVYSCRQAGLDRSDRREMLLISMIRLEPLLVRRRVLGTDQGIRGSVLFGLEV